MIEYALLVMLGFCVAGLLALLIAPTIWRRAVRLTTKRLDATLPLTLSDIEADKDLLRASYAVQIRRLEAGLNKARDKSASQLVEISKLQMVIGEFRDRAGELERQLEERSNAANVFERTIRKRFPELEAALNAAKAAIDGRFDEIADLHNNMRRKDEAVSMLQRSSGLQQAEIRTLRERLEGGGADKTGRFKKRPAQWTLEEFRAEYDRLNLELSKMREQLALAQEREAGQVAVLRTELQNLAEQIMSAAASRDKQLAEQQRAADPATKPSVREPAAAPHRRTLAERALPAPQPWLRAADNPQPARQPEPTVPAANPARTRTTTAAKSDEPRHPTSERTFMRPSERRPSITGEASHAGARPEAAASQTLVSRANPVSSKPGEAQLQAGAEPRPAAVSDRAAEPAPVSRSDVKPNEAAAGTAKPAEPNLDRMLREIFEGHGTGQQPAPGDAAQAALPDSVEEEEGNASSNADVSASSTGGAEGDGETEADGDKKPTLLERLRVV
jgi:hypothetical protein